MSYTVLARKYRPQTFADLVGQEHVTRTLSNAITTGRVAHAFLFTGVRGVGKTTSARILAKALNCERGPTPEPCNHCDPCREITAGVDLDVLEIDGASNNGVDDVRRLQESLPYRPARDRQKIVIVDEVHMLSSGAFNAFLKTLEEPPPHVKFIFATTESHKVPVTIRSRCQRYDFRLIPQSVIAGHVARILGAEGIEADAHALAIVAREAAGSMRDALTLLDQIVAFSGEKLLGADVAQKLGLADREQLFQVAEAVLAGDAKRALEVIDAVASRGLDFSHFARQWLELMRDMVVVRVAAARPDLVELPEDERAQAERIARAHDLLELERVFSGLAKLIDELARASSPRVVLEMGAVRLATRPPLQDLAALIARLQQLESGGGPSPAPSGRAHARPSPPAGGSGANFEGPSRGPEPATATRTIASKDATPAKPNPFSRFVPPESSAAQPRELAPPAPSEMGPARELSQRPPAEVRREPHLTEPRARTEGGAALELVPALAPMALAPTAAPTAQVSVEPARAATPEPARAATPEPARAAMPEPAPAAPAAHTPPQEQWSAIVRELRTREPRWSAMFEHGVPEELSERRVLVVFPEGSFFGRQAQTQGGLDALRRASHAVLQAEPEVQVRFAAELRGQSIAQQEAAQLDERKEAIKRKALSHPRVVEAFKVFPELAQKQDVQVD